jgi:hypothetical protein
MFGLHPLLLAANSLALQQVDLLLPSMSKLRCSEVSVLLPLWLSLILWVGLLHGKIWNILFVVQCSFVVKQKALFVSYLLQSEQRASQVDKDKPCGKSYGGSRAVPSFPVLSAANR